MNLDEMKRQEEIVPPRVLWKPETPGATLKAVFTHVDTLPKGIGEGIFLENADAKYIVVVNADLRLKKDQLESGKPYEFVFKGFKKISVEGYSDKRVYNIYPLA